VPSVSFSSSAARI